jgi:Mg2+ and Co2+ transporter CorA
LSWVNVERPTSTEAELLIREYRLRRADVEQALDRAATSGVWHRDGYVLAIFQIPYLATSKRPVRATPSPVAIFAGSDYLVVIHTGEIRPLARYFRQCQADASVREATFGLGVAGLVYAVVHRLVDAAWASRARIERLVDRLEEPEPGPDDQAGPRGAVERLSRLRGEARGLRRLVEALPATVGATARAQPLPVLAADEWDRLIARAERLVRIVDDDLLTIDSGFLSLNAVAALEQLRYLRILAVVITLTLPVLLAIALLTMPLGAPLAGQPNAYAIAVGLAGLVFLIALFWLRQKGLV